MVQYYYREHVFEANNALNPFPVCFEYTSKLPKYNNINEIDFVKWDKRIKTEKNGDEIRYGDQKTELNKYLDSNTTVINVRTEVLQILRSIATEIGDHQELFFCYINNLREMYGNNIFKYLDSILFISDDNISKFYKYFSDYSNETIIYELSCMSFINKCKSHNKHIYIYRYY